MSKTPVLTAIDVIRGLRKQDLSYIARYNPATKRRTSVFNHPGADIPKRTLKAILKEAGISLEDFLSLLD